MDFEHLLRLGLKNMSVVERCLSHIDPNDRYHGAYRRGQMISQRKRLLQAWANYCYSAVELPNTLGQSTSTLK